MITIREYLEWRIGDKKRLEDFLMRFQEAKGNVSLQNTTRVVKASGSSRRKRPTERFSEKELRRMMGDVGPRQFLKDLGGRRK
jgi:hypothetical protein